jgi:predicted nucleic acid-binding protein
MIFVDSGAWFAAAVLPDRRHAEARRWLEQNTEPLLTTDYIVDETLTLLRARGEPKRALTVGGQFFLGELATIYHVTEDDIRAAWDVFRRYADKEWSFTDCTSKVVMDRLQITTAFAFDKHFHQFGGIIVVP